MTKKLTARLVPLVLVIALVFTLGLALAQTPASPVASAEPYYQEGCPITSYVDTVEYHFVTPNVYIDRAESQTAVWLSSGVYEEPITLDADYVTAGGTITVSLFDAKEGAVSGSDYIEPGEYTVHVEWSTAGDFDAGDANLPLTVIPYQLNAKLEDTFITNDFRFGADTTGWYYEDSGKTYLSDLYLQSSFMKADDAHDVSLVLYFQNAEGEQVKPVNAGEYTYVAELVGTDADLYALYCEDIGATNQPMISYPVTLLPMELSLEFHLAYDGVTLDSDKFSSDQSGIAYTGNEFDVYATTNVPGVLFNITDWKDRNHFNYYGITKVTNVGEYSLDENCYSISIDEDDLYSDLVASNYYVDTMGADFFVFRVEKRPISFYYTGGNYDGATWTSTARYRDGMAVEPTLGMNTHGYEIGAQLTSTEDTIFGLSTYNIPNFYDLADIPLTLTYATEDFNVGDTNNVQYSLPAEYEDAFELLIGYDPGEDPTNGGSGYEFTVVKGVLQDTDAYSSTQTATWYAYEHAAAAALGANAFTQFVQSKFALGYHTYKTEKNLQGEDEYVNMPVLDSSTWYYYTGDTWVNAFLPNSSKPGAGPATDSHAGRYMLKVDTKATGEYEACTIYIDVEITKAPIYVQWLVDFQTYDSETPREYDQTGSSISPSVSDDDDYNGVDDFRFYLFSKDNVGVAAYEFDTVVGSDFYHYVPAYVSGGGLYAGTYDLTWTQNTNLDMTDYFDFVDPELSIIVKYEMRGVSQFKLPAEFVYGGEDGNSYYQTPFIDYVAASSDINEETHKAANPDPVIGTMDFGTTAVQYRIPYLEVWEFKKVGDEDWTPWATGRYVKVNEDDYYYTWTLTTINNPTAVGTYLVRYTATMCQQSGHWSWWLDEDDPFYIAGEEYTRSKYLLYSINPANGLYKVEFTGSVETGDGTFEITARPLEILFSDCSFTYDGTAHNVTMVVNNFAYGEQQSDIVALTEDQTDVGIYDAIASLKGDAPNYSLPAEYSTILQISKKALTITANANAITYGDAPAANGVSYDGFEGTDDASVLGGTLAYAFSYSQYGDIGSYTITPSGLTSDNYEITFMPGTLTVNSKSINVDWESIEYTYTGVAQAFPTASTKDGVNDDDVSMTVTIDGEATFKDYGTYTFTAALTTPSDNYTLVGDSADYTIAKKALTVTPKQNQKKTYGDANPAYTFDISGNQNGETAADILSGALSREEGENVGTYAITQGTLTSNANYTITFTSGIVFTIETRNVTVKPDVKSKTYGEDDPKLTYTVLNTFSDEEPTFNMDALTRAAGEDNGSYAVTLPDGFGFAEDDFNANYTFDFDSTVVFKIMGAMIDTSAVSFVNAAVDYNGAAQAIPAPTNLPAGVSIASYTYNGSATVPTNAGEYGVTVTLVSDDENVGLSQATFSATFTINKLTLKIIPSSNQNKTYGEADPVFGYVYTGNVTGEAPKFEGALSRANGETVNDYAFTLGTLALADGYAVNANYETELDFDDSVVFTINPRAVTLTLAEKHFIYGQEGGDEYWKYDAPTVTAGDLGFSDKWSDICSVTFNLSATQGVSKYWINLSTKANGNYTATLQGANYYVDEREVTLSWNVGSYVYDGETAFAPTATAGNLKNGDEIGVTVTGEKTAAGVDYVATASALTGDKAANYKLPAEKTTLFSIAKATYDMSGVSFDDKTVSYNGETQSIVISGDLPAGVSVNYQNNGSKNVVKDQLATAIFTVADPDNYNLIPDMTAKLTIEKITVTLVPNALDKFYGEADPALTYSWSGIYETPAIYGALTRAAGETAGTYAIDVSAIGLTNDDVNDNYILAKDDTVLFTIKARPIKIQAKNQTKTYGEAAKTLGAGDFTFVEEGGFFTSFGYSDTFEAIFGFECEVDEQSDVNEYEISIIDLENPNYALATVAGTYTVEKKAITVTYNQTSNCVATFMDGESWSVLGDPYDYLDANIEEWDSLYDVVEIYFLNAAGKRVDIMDLETSVAGTYTMVAADAENANYEITGVDDGIIDLGENKDEAYLVINKWVYHIIPDAGQKKTYGEADDEFTFKVWTTIVDWNDEYDEEDEESEEFIRTFTDVTEYKDLYFLGKIARVAGENAGTYAYTLGTFELLEITEINDENDAWMDTVLKSIEIVLDDEVYTIEKAPLMIGAVEKTITYGDAPANAGLQYVGFIDGEDETVLGGEAAYAYTYEQFGKTGKYLITPSGLTSDNYNIVFIPGELIVVKKAITVTANESSIEYGEDPVDADVTFTGLVGEDSAASFGGKAVFAFNYEKYGKVGEYVITPSGLTSDNYEITYATGVLTVTKKPITVTAAAKDSDYEAALVDLTVKESSLTVKKEGGVYNVYALNDDLVATLATDADNTKAGEYKITVTDKQNANYTVTATDAKYLIKAAVETKEDGALEKTETITPEAIKEAAEKNEGVSIKNMIDNVIKAAAEAPVATLVIEIGEKTEDGKNTTTIAFDKAALQKLAGNDDVKITYKETKAADVDTSKKELKKAQLVIEVSLGGASFEGGTATVTTAFENKAPGGKKAVVYYVTDDGKKEKMDAIFADGMVTFETTHFSTYTVEYVLTGGSIAGIVIGCVVGAAAIAVLVFFLLKKKGAKKEEAPADAE